MMKISFGHDQTTDRTKQNLSGWYTSPAAAARAIYAWAPSDWRSKVRLAATEPAGVPETSMVPADDGAGPGAAADVGSSSTALVSLGVFFKAEALTEFKISRQVRWLRSLYVHHLLETLLPPDQAEWSTKMYCIVEDDRFADRIATRIPVETVTAGQRLFF